MKSLIAPLLFGLLGAMVMADPLNLSPLFTFGTKSPVGTCPSKDGEQPTYLADSENCEIFYECSGGEPFPKECMPGLCFDTVLNVCAFPNLTDEAEPLSAVGTCPPRDTNVTIYLQDDKNCSVYYICSNGVPIQNICPEDMSWNTKLNICDWNIDANCQPGAERMPYNAVGTCPPRDGNATTFLSDDKNCSIYYVCSNGVPIQNVCPEGMAWNTKLNICDWDIDVGCNLGNATYEDIEISPLSAVGTCPEKDTNVTVFLPDSANCSIYYICSNGRPVQALCPPNMSWNTVLNTCDWDIDSNCKAGNSTSRKAVGTCPDTDPPTPVFLPDSDDCQLYYECSNGVAVQNNCPDDLEFNPVTMVCEFYLDAGCKAGGNNTTNSTVIF